MFNSFKYGALNALQYIAMAILLIATAIVPAIVSPLLWIAQFLVKKGLLLLGYAAILLAGMFTALFPFVTALAIRMTGRLRPEKTEHSGNK